ASFVLFPSYTGVGTPAVMVRTRRGFPLDFETPRVNRQKFSPNESGLGHTTRSLGAKIIYRRSAEMILPSLGGAPPGGPDVVPRGRGGPRLAGPNLSAIAAGPDGH